MFKPVICMLVSIPNSSYRALCPLLSESCSFMPTPSTPPHEAGDSANPFPVLAESSRAGSTTTRHERGLRQADLIYSISNTHGARDVMPHGCRRLLPSACHKDLSRPSGTTCKLRELTQLSYTAYTAATSMTPSSSLSLLQRPA